MSNSLALAERRRYSSLHVDVLTAARPRKACLEKARERIRSAEPTLPVDIDEPLPRVTHWNVERPRQSSRGGRSVDRHDEQAASRSMGVHDGCLSVSKTRTRAHIQAPEAVRPA